MTSVLQICSAICGVMLAIYITYDAVVTRSKYQRLKLLIASGGLKARARFYYEILVFEWVSAALALVALKFDFARLNPSRLQLSETGFIGSWISMWTRLGPGFLAGMGIAVVIGSIAAPWIMQRTQGRLPMVGDFAALIPSTLRERLIFALVALSAGICEELVFRGWLVDALHGALALNGAASVVTASVIFGLVHYYQGLYGILSTSVLGFVFCALYIGTGSLVVPIVVHALLDLRLVVLSLQPPARR